MKRDDFIRFVLLHPDMEGGGECWNDPYGGLTKFGVCAESYPHLDIANLTLEQAVAIAVKDYWLPCRCSEIEAGNVAPQTARLLFDFAYNSGVKTAVKTLQRILKVTADGVAGPKTLAAVRRAGDQHAVLYLAKRVVFMSELANWGDNATGWAKRLFTLADYTFTGKEWLSPPKLSQP